ncbi:MAG: ABC transporter transmembrane domain-containing protein, partial [Bacteroidota bacterium]|nr:ABC transporter transmembrane domain-containing protein [Bacteroidota bacterium]
MAIRVKNKKSAGNKPPGISSLLKPYKGLIVLLILFALLSNGLNLLLPAIIAKGIDTYTHHQFSFRNIIKQFLLATLLVFVFTYLQTIIQTYTSEKVARDVRSRLADKISHLSYAALEQANPSKLL